MDAIISQQKSIQGKLTVPSDKAICHRVILLGAIAQGKTKISPWPESDDCRRTLEIVRALGISVERSAGAVELNGLGMSGIQQPKNDLDCGESGTTMRLVSGLLAGQPFRSRLVSGPLLMKRPMKRISEPLSQMGARFESPAGGDNEFYPPLTIYGRRPLQAIEYTVPVASAQVKSAILLAGLFARGKTTVIEPHQTRDHTERFLKAFGVHAGCDGNRVFVESADLVSPGDVFIPGDFSSAAFFLVAAACLQDAELTIEKVSLNPSRTGLLKILKRFGAEVHSVEEESSIEPYGSIMIKSQNLEGIRLTADEVPAIIDEVPILMVAAALAKGKSVFEGLTELRVKETDRISSMVDGLRKLGAQIREVGRDSVEIKGSQLKGATVDSANDHRTVMSLAIAGMAARGTTRISNAECVAKSFPDFFDRLRGLIGQDSVKTIDKT